MTAMDNVVVAATVEKHEASTYLINELVYHEKGMHLLFFSMTGLIGYIVCDVLIIVPLILSKGVMMGRADVTDI